MNTPYASPADIDSVEMKIQTVSQSSQPKLYANGRNRLPVEIIVKAMSRDYKILKFSQATMNLTRKGTAGWCFTDIENEYSREPLDLLSRNLTAFSTGDNGSAIIILYVYTDQQDIKRISVSLDTAAGTSRNKHFTTADKAVGSEKSHIQVFSKNRIDYSIHDLHIDPVYRLNPTTARVHYDITSHGAWGVSEHHKDRYFPCHYDNYYIGLKNNYKILNAGIHGYSSPEGDRKWLCAYDSSHNNQHMIIAHPFNTGKQTEEFGFDNTASWSAGSWWGFYQNGKATFHLKQTVTYNERANHICFTQMAFSSSEKWELPEDKGLDIDPYYFDSWFDFYDEYGNYGKFTVRFTSDNSYIDITKR